MTTTQPDHDALYHRFFSDPAIVAQLLRAFVDSAFLEGLDLDGLERLNTKLHADTGERREADLVWRIPRRDGGDAYVMLLLEFQSTPDRWMALRMLVYAGLLWQHLVKEQRLLPDGRLPPILPIVLYNGDPRWHAPVELRDLIGLPDGSALWHWQPGIRYHLIDEGAFSPGDLEQREGLPALLFRLENSPDPLQLVDLADAVLAWFGRHPGFQTARSVFVEMLSAAMAPLGPDVRVPEQLLEVRNMLVARMEAWAKQSLLEAEQRGEQRGEERGRQLGEERGRQLGEERGRQLGEERGRRLGEERGRQIGEQRGEATLLLRLLERRFGALPDWTGQRVLAADIPTLEEWGLRVLDATSLDEVFA